MQSPTAECGCTVMDSLRTAANSFVLKIIFSVIIVSFILTGVSGYLIGGDNNFTTKMNSREVSHGQFENALNSERNRMQQQLGDRYPELATNEGYMKALHQQMLNHLVDEALLDQCSRELKLNISDGQVKQTIFATLAFQVDDKSDNNRYNTIVNRMGMTAGQYAQALRNQLMTQQLINGVTGTDFMLKGETDELAALVAQQRIVREATIDVSALIVKQSVTEQEVASYYEQNKNNFMTPGQFRVSYIKPGAAAMQGTANDTDIQSCYDQHQDQFTQPQRNRYNIIQTRTEDEAKAVLDELNKGGDFTTLAKEKSADIISARKSGDMGWLEDSATPDELKNASLKGKGRLSGVVKSPVGFLVMRLDGVQPVQIKPLGEARDEITAKVRQEKTLDACYTPQQKVSDAASNDNESLAGAKQAAGMRAVEAGWFSRDSLPGELNFEPVAGIIFNGGLVSENGTPGSNSDIITADGDHAFVSRIAERKAEAVKPLAEMKEQVTALVKHNEVERQAKFDTDKLLADLKAGKGDEAMKMAGLSLGEARTLSRTGQDPLSQAAFDLGLPAKDKPSYGVANDMQGDVVLLVLDEVKTGSMPEAQKKAMVQGITQNSAQIIFGALMSNLHKAAKIKIGGVLE